MLVGGVPRGGVARGVLLLWADVTAQSGDGEGGSEADAASLRRELAALQETLARCRDEQHELDEFISLLAHDLRTPLTSIRGYAQLMQRNRTGTVAVDGAIASGLQTIIEQSDRLSAMTNVLLDISRVRLQRIALIPTRVDLASALRVALGAWRAERLPPALELETPSLYATADAKRVPQMARVLLDFFAYRTDPSVAVVCRLSREGEQAALVVEDRGDPLAPLERARLFDQLLEDPSLTAERRLARADLYILRGVAEARGGSVVVESPVPETGQGVRLALRLPLAPES